MNIQLPDDVLKQARKTEMDVLIELAIMLYEKKISSLGKAAEIIGVSRFELQKELALRKIPLPYDVSDLENDLQNLEQIK